MRIIIRPVPYIARHTQPFLHQISKMVPVAVTAAVSVYNHRVTVRFHPLRMATWWMFHATVELTKQICSRMNIHQLRPLHSLSTSLLHSPLPKRLMDASTPLLQPKVKWLVYHTLQEFIRVPSHLRFILQPPVMQTQCVPLLQALVRTAQQLLVLIHIVPILQHYLQAAVRVSYYMYLLVPSMAARYVGTTSIKVSTAGICALIRSPSHCTTFTHMR